MELALEFPEMANDLLDGNKRPFKGKSEFLDSGARVGHKGTRILEPRSCSGKSMQS